MKIPFLSRLRRKEKVKSDVPSLILMYHRVADERADPWDLCVSPANFAEQLDVLKRHFNLYRLDRFADMVKEGTLPERSVAVTFDDGYADNLYAARPLLEKFSIPATFFIPSGLICNNRAFWWDELEGIFLYPGLLPESLSIKIGGTRHEWTLGRNSLYSDEEAQRYSAWKAWDKGPTIRHELYYSLWKALKCLEEDERRAILDELSEWSGSGAVNGSYRRPVNENELKELGQGDMFEVGAHSVTHADFTITSLQVLMEEISGSRLSLENYLGSSVNSFAYPYGAYNAETPVLVRDAGFSCACTTVEESVRPGTDRFLLPRVGVCNWDGHEFEGRLHKWLQ